MLTPFPEMVRAVISESILGRSEKKKLIKFHIKNLFDFSDPPHHRIDDYPFGGGPGMIIRPDVVEKATVSILRKLNIKIPEIPFIYIALKWLLLLQERVVLVNRMK